jgi:hypothetical protein
MPRYMKISDFLFQMSCGDGERHARCELRPTRGNIHLGRVPCVRLLFLCVKLGNRFRGVPAKSSFPGNQGSPATVPHEKNDQIANCSNCPLKYSVMIEKVEDDCERLSMVPWSQSVIYRKSSECPIFATDLRKHNKRPKELYFKADHQFRVISGC